MRGERKSGILVAIVSAELGLAKASQRNYCYDSAVEMYSKVP